MFEVKPKHSEENGIWDDFASVIEMLMTRQETVCPFATY
jgi:hypothetical protein